MEPQDSGVVLAAERSYLAERRRLAGIVPRVAGAPAAGAPAAGAPAAGAPAAARPIGISLSGGGIRSATFNLGILQALSMLRILPRFDYLSTVSGGGYIGSCLTSLLSRRKCAKPADGDDAYLIEPPRDPPRFGTVPETFPFNAQSDEQAGLGAFNGRAQVRHLRTHGDFIIARNQVLSRDMLRAVGNVLGGIFYHLLMFVLFLVGAAGIYLAIVCYMAGDIRQQFAPTGFSFPDYVTKLIEWPGFGGLRGYPVTWAFVTGALVTLFSLLVTGIVLRRMPDSRFLVDGQSAEDTKEIRALQIQFGCTAVTAAVVTWCYVSHAAAHGGVRLVFLLLPLGVYFGGTASALFLHAVVAMLPSATRNERSRFAAVKGILNYLSLASYLMLLLPWLIYWLTLPGHGFSTGGGWLVSLVATSLLARRGKGGAAGAASGAGAGAGAASGTAGGWLKRLFGLSASIRNALLSVLVVFLLIGGVVLISSGIMVLADRLEVTLLSLSLVIGVMSLGIFSLLGFVLDFNDLSLHYFYRDRLVEAYLQTYAPKPGQAQSGPELLQRDDAEMLLTHIHGCKPAPAGTPPGAPPSPDCVTAAPLHLVVTSLNLTASRDMTRRDRKSDQFIFSKLYCGSDTTGYLPTGIYRSGKTKLARALTISGAAASSAMGSGTFFAEAFALTLFNGRLGQWMENPRYKKGAWARRNEGFVFWPFYLLREMLGSTDATRRLIHLSDGGHTGDNLGIMPLLKRRCAVIVACDAEADPRYAFGSLTEALRQIYIDENIKVDLDLAPLRPDPETGLSERHYMVGRIRYPKTADSPEETGWLLVLKSSLAGDELARIENYKQENPDFPQQSTADQFFDDDQFESYRELGYHVAKVSLQKVSDTAWQPELGKDWEACWEGLIP